MKIPSKMLTRNKFASESAHRDLLIRTYEHRLLVASEREEEKNTEIIRLRIKVLVMSQWVSSRGHPLEEKFEELYELERNL